MYYTLIYNTTIYTDVEHRPYNKRYCNIHTLTYATIYTDKEHKTYEKRYCNIQYTLTYTTIYTDVNTEHTIKDINIQWLIQQYLQM